MTGGALIHPAAASARTTVAPNGSPGAPHPAARSSTLELSNPIKAAGHTNSDGSPTVKPPTTIPPVTLT
jgi:hypothetical protein